MLRRGGSWGDQEATYLYKSEISSAVLDEERQTYAEDRGLYLWVPRGTGIYL